MAYMAARTGAAVLIVRHMNKSGGASPLYRGGGSIGIIGAARAGLLAAPDPDDDSRRILAVTKSNLAAMPEALAYRLVTEEQYGVARVVWDGATGHKAADLLRLPGRDDEDGAPARSEAEQVLAEILAEGPVPAKKVKAIASEAGVAERTLARAREALGVTTQREGFGPGARYVWALPEPPCVPPETPMDPMDAIDVSSQSPGTHGTHGDPVAGMDPGEPPPLFDPDDPDDPGRWTA
jgi:hypothetical protein